MTTAHPSFMMLVPLKILADLGSASISFTYAGTAEAANIVPKVISVYQQKYSATSTSRRPSTPRNVSKNAWSITFQSMLCGCKYRQWQHSDLSVCHVSDVPHHHVAVHADDIARQHLADETTRIRQRLLVKPCTSSIRHSSGKTPRGVDVPTRIEAKRFTLASTSPCEISPFVLLLSLIGFTTNAVPMLARHLRATFAPRIEKNSQKAQRHNTLCNSQATHPASVKHARSKMH